MCTRYLGMLSVFGLIRPFLMKNDGKKMLFFRKMMTSNIGRDSIPDVGDVQTSSNMYNSDIHSGSIITPSLGTSYYQRLDQLILGNLVH